MTTPTPRPVGSSGPTPAPTAKSKLAGIKRGRLRSPKRLLFYGPEGVGKSSLGADSHKPIFLDIEGGTSELDLCRYPFNDSPGSEHVPSSLDDVMRALDDVESNEHDYCTLVIDTVDALESLIHKHICVRDGKASIKAYGYGDGYKVALDEWRRLLGRLDRLRSRGLDIVLLGHSTVNLFRNPEGEDFDRYQLRVNQLSSGLLREWSDVVGFVHFEGGGEKLKLDASQSKRARGWATGRRLVELQRSAAWDAKCRLSLPAQIDLVSDHPWKPFAEARELAQSATADSLSADGAAELARVTGIPADDVTTDVEFMTASGAKTTRQAIRKLLTETDQAVLARVLAGLRATSTIGETK